MTRAFPAALRLVLLVGVVMTNFSCAPEIDGNSSVYVAEVQADSIEVHPDPMPFALNYRASDVIVPELPGYERSDFEFEDLARSEWERSRQIIQVAMAKYPFGVISSIRQVNILKSIRVQEIAIGGANLVDVVCVANDGIHNGYSDGFLERAFHSEVSSVILECNWDKFPYADWIALLPEGFDYGSGGLDEIRSGRAMFASSEQLHRAGFLYQYGTSSLENDFNSIAEELFMNSGEFWEAVDEHPLLSQKGDLVVQFYSLIDPTFGTKYFRSLPSEGRCAMITGALSPEKIACMSREEVLKVVARVTKDKQIAVEADCDDEARRLEIEFELLMDRLRALRSSATSDP